MTELVYLSPDESNRIKSIDNSLRSNSIAECLVSSDISLPKRLHLKNVYYKPYIWARKLEDSGWSWKSFNSLTRYLILGVALCPFLWYGLTTFINLYEGLSSWQFSYPGVLWIVYFIATTSVLADFVINAFLIRCIAAEKIILNNLLMDFIIISSILSICLIPMMYKVSTSPDDDFNSTYTQMSVNLLDSFSIVALTAGNTVVNKLVESVIHTAVFNKMVYLEEDNDCDFKEANRLLPEGSTDKLPGLPMDEEVGKVKMASDDAKNMSDQKGQEKPLPSQMSIKTMLKFVAGQLKKTDDKRKTEEHLYMYSILETMIDDFEWTSATGKFRFCLRAKMVINLASSTLFAFYSSIYLSAKNGCYIFVLFLTVLSFLNNLTSAMVVKVHDDAVKLTYANEAFETVLSIGKFNGFNHVQFYSTTLVSLVNLAFRVSITKAN